MLSKEEKITIPALLRCGFVQDESGYSISLGDARTLFYKPKEKILYLYNVYLNRLRTVTTMQQIDNIYNAITDKTIFPIIYKATTNVAK